MRIYICFLLLLGSLSSIAQNNTGTLKGTVMDNGSRLEFATVFVTTSADTSKIVSGTVTDSLGVFVLDKLPLSEYVLTIRMIGFSQRRIEISLTVAKPTVDLKEIFLATDATLLNAVEVQAIRDVIKKTEDGFVMNAKDNITQIGGTAADLLRNMPGVLVDGDGGITIRGKTPLTLINGRVSGIAGVDRSAQLDRIPASSIERIEIINNPSAKYDADAESGVINIVLKKSEGAGTNGAFAIGAGRGDRYRLNGSMLLNHKTDKWNLGAAYDNWYTTRTRRVTGDRANFDLSDDRYLIQRRFDERLIFYQNAKATVDYAPTSKSNFSMEALWAFPGENNNETLNNTLQSEGKDFTSGNQRHSNEIRRTHTLELFLNYTKKFANPDKQLSANVSNTFNKDRENTDITTLSLDEGGDVLGNSSLQRTHTYQKTNLLNASVDFVQPVGAKGTLESGYKGIQRLLNSDYERSTLLSGQYVVDPLNSNIFDFREQIHAAYTQYTGWVGEKAEPKMKYNFGLRAEEVWNTGRTVDESQKFNNEYFNLYPSVNFFFYMKKGNNLKVSYSRRINRPGLDQLNPFIDITDSLNQHSGNPRLKPELIHSMEVGYSHSIGKHFFSVTGFYRIKNHAILNYTILDPNGVALSLPLNFGHAATYGLEAIATINPVSFWSANVSFSAFEIMIEDNGTVADLSRKQSSWYSKLINNFSISRNSKLQIIGNYTSRAAISQGSTIEIYNVDAGFQQTIMKGQGRLGAVITDVFNTQRSGSVLSANNFEQARSTKLDTRAIMLTFGYTFSGSFKDKLMENRFKND